MTDRAAVAVAIAAVAGALEGWGSSLWVGASCVVIALVVRRPVVLAIGVVHVRRPREIDPRARRGHEE